MRRETARGEHHGGAVNGVFQGLTPMRESFGAKIPAIVEAEHHEHRRCGVDLGRWRREVLELRDEVRIVLEALGVVHALAAHEPDTLTILERQLLQPSYFSS